MTLDLCTPARILWDACGRPPSPRGEHACDAGAICALCGASCAGVASRYADAMPETFTDHDAALAPWSPWVCVPCAWALSGKPPDTLRLWSWVHREGWAARPPSNPKVAQGKTGPTRLAPLAEHPAVWAGAKDGALVVAHALLDPPDGRWFVSVADSGQLHVVPFAPLNDGRAGGAVRFERWTIRHDPAAFARLVHAWCALDRAGFVADDIATGDVHPSKIVKHGIAVWREHDATLAPHRGSPLLALVGWCINRHTVEDLYARTSRADAPAVARGSGELGRGSAPGPDGLGLDRDDPAAGLVAARESGAGGGGGDGAGLWTHGVHRGVEAPDRDPAPGLGQQDLLDWLAHR